MPTLVRSHHPFLPGPCGIWLFFFCLVPHSVHMTQNPSAVTLHSYPRTLQSQRYRIIGEFYK